MRRLAGSAYSALFANYPFEGSPCRPKWVNPVNPFAMTMFLTLFQGLSPASRRHTFPGTDVFVICFSVVQPNSFRNIVQKWVPEIRQFTEDIPFILVGTQTDLREDDRTIRSLEQKGQRPITAREATLLCRRLGGACYIESSPVMKKRMRRVMNDAFVSVFRPKEEETTCTIL